MNSISQECQQLKNDYDHCFNKWFRDKFLRGVKEDECKELFKAYQVCVKKGIREKGINLEEVERNILGTEHEKTTPPPKDGHWW